MFVASHSKINEVKFFLASVNLRNNSFASGESAAAMGTDMDITPKIYISKKRFLLFIFFSFLYIKLKYVVGYSLPERYNYNYTVYIDVKETLLLQKKREFDIYAPILEPAKSIFFLLVRWQCSSCRVKACARICLLVFFTRFLA